MSRSLRCSVGLVGLVLAILAVVGCEYGSDSSAPEGPTRVKPLGHAAPAPTETEPTKLLADWPKPDGAILISGEQIGFLEPCGCSSGQRGGLARRLDLIRKLEAQGWDLVKVDLGSLINDPNTKGGPLETSIRYTHALKALEIMEYDAFALSPTDLKLGVDEVLAQYMNHLGERPKVVSANVRPVPGLDENVVKSVRAQAGPIQVGITAVIDTAAFEALKDPSKTALLNFSAPGEVLPEVLADLESDTDVQMLLVQGSPAAARRIAQRNPGFEVVVATSAFVDPPRDVELLNDGKTRLVTVGKKGQWVGVLGLYQDSEQKFRYQRVELNQRYDVTAEPIYGLLNDEFEAALKQADVLTNYPRRAYVSGSSPTEATFIGAETCKQCHPKTYAHWSQSRHAHAYEALVSGPRGNHQFDAHCISCHTVGFEYLGGFVNAELTPQFKNVQCENCHGPGSQHAADPDNAQFLQAVAADVEDFRQNNRCIACHTGDDSPHFDFETYWPKIIHNDLDTYDDPRVHQGVTSPDQVARKDATAESGH